MYPSTYVTLLSENCLCPKHDDVLIVYVRVQFYRRTPLNVMCSVDSYHVNADVAESK